MYKRQYGDWENQLDRIETVVNRFQKPFFFAETGCMSVKGSKEVPNDWCVRGDADPKGQAEWYEDMFTACSKRDWVGGMALWSLSLIHICVVYGDVALDCGVGNFSMEGSVEGNLKADCGMGSMTLDLNGEEKEYNYKLSCGLGSIDVDGETYSNISGDKEVKNEGAEKNMELDCGMGSIEVDFE